MSLKSRVVTENTYYRHTYFEPRWGVGAVLVTVNQGIWYLIGD